MRISLARISFAASEVKEKEGHLETDEVIGESAGKRK